MNASPPAPAAPAPLRIQRAPPDDRPLREWLGLRAREAALGPSGRAAVAREMVVVLPEIGRYADALVYDDMRSASRPEQPDALRLLDGYAPEDALEAVVRASRGRQVVMVNEAHPVPQHRAFTLQLLARLRAEGFTWFAAETLFEEDTALNARGYPVSASGAYTLEPVYGDLVRTALALGFRVVPYDSPPGIDLDPRERMQAANLVERILQKDPDARIVVHAGYGHIAKAVRPGALVPMAVRFRQLTGIEPYTIDQSQMTEHSRPELEVPLYRAAATRGDLVRPTVYVDSLGTPWSASRAHFDATVFSPRTVLEQGRPQWLRMGGLRAPHPLPADVCGTARACLVRARLEGEAADAVPVDQVVVLAGEAVPALMLPAGRFRVTVEGPDAAVLRTFALQAPPH